MLRKHYSRAASIALVAGMYLVALGLGILTFFLAERAMPEIWALLLADVVMTVIIWGFGLLYENVSVYDPYWSVIPPVFFTLWAFYKGCFTLPVILLLVSVWWWGIRLTGNWAWTFQGLAHEDWRYTRYREQMSPFLFQLTNFFGLNMMPTLLVFACMLPGFGLFEAAGPANALTWPGFAICIGAATLQLVADTQIHRFRAAHPRRVCDAGLWTSPPGVRCRPVEARPPSQLFRRDHDVVGRLGDVRLPPRDRLAHARAFRHDRPLPLHQHSDDGAPPAGAQAGICRVQEAYAAVHLTYTIPFFGMNRGMRALSGFVVSPQVNL